MRPRRAVVVLSVALVTLPLLVAACDEDKPTAPPLDRPPEFGDPTSADQLVENFQVALAARDSVQMVSTLADGFTLRLDPDHVDEAGYAADFMTHAEAVRAAGNLFRGQVLIDDDVVRAPVTDIAVARLAPVDAEWRPALKQEYPLVMERRYALEVTTTFAGAPAVTAAGEVIFAAADLSGEGDAVPAWALIALADESLPAGSDPGTPCFGRLWRDYLGNRAPTALVAPEQAEGSADGPVLFDAAGSSDPEDALHEQPYRWRFDEAGDWSAWTAAADTAHTFTEPGVHVVTLAVRDRWGASGVDFASAEIAGYHEPTHPDSVVANFVEITSARAVPAYEALLDDGFLFVLHHTVDGHEVWDRDDELFIAGNLFTGQPGGPAGEEPGIESITVFVTPLLTWEPIAADHPRFGGTTGVARNCGVNLFFQRPAPATSFIVSGLARFYVSEVAAHGRTEYRLLGIEDMTLGLKRQRPQRTSPGQT